MLEPGTFFDQFHFLRPWWLLGLLAVLAMYWVLQRSARGAQWHKIIAPALIPLLLQQRDGRVFNPRPWLLASGIIAILALAGPTWNKKSVPVYKQQQALLILFDLSPSMLATDIKPDRLTRARLKTIDLLNAYQEGFAALVAYAGDAHVVTPLTDDTNTVISQLPALHPAIMPSAGSNVEAALAKALELAVNAGHQEGDILLVTDGVTADARENLHRMMRDNPAFRLSILGVGTDDGAPVPLNEHGFARDGQGSIVIASLGSQTLRGLAQRNGGVYRTISGTDADIKALLKPFNDRANVDTRELERSLDVWEDRGIWLALALLPVTLLLFRRGALVVLLLMPLLYTPGSEASWWDDLWLRKDQQGYRKLRDGEAHTAQGLFTDPAWQGIAASEAGSHAVAAEAFARLDTASAHYNRGNALARAGKLEEAIAAYEEALSREPGMEDAAFNKALVERLKNQQQQQQQQQRHSDASQQQSPENAQSDSQDASHDDAGQSATQPRQGQQSDGAGDPSATNEMRDEDMPSDQGSQPGNDSLSDAQLPEPAPDSSGEAAESVESETSRGERNSLETATGSVLENGEGEQDSLQNTIESEDAAQQNAQQWLRRVPDDPGGLLRNKFHYEARQRFREERSGPRLPPGNYSEERW